MKGKINLKNRKTILLSVITSILVIIGIISFILNKPKANNVLYSSELERAEIEQMRTYDKVEVNDSKVENCPNIEFDAFFARDLDGDGYSEGIRGSCIQIGKEDTLYMELHINDGGTLKNGKITINNDNFYFDTAIPKSEDVKENAISNNTKEILLTDTDTNRGTGKQITLTGNVKSGTYDRTRNIIDAIGNDISKLSNNENSQNRNSITLTGTYVTVDEEGQTTETEINKTVYFNLDWYGTTSTSLPNYLGNGNYNYKNQKYNIQNIIDEENQEIHLDFKVLTRENNYQLNLNNSEIKINLPEIQECSPIRVEAEGAEVKYIYDETDSEKILGAIISKKAVLDENNTVKENAYTDTYAYTNAFYRYNIFNIKVIYPIDAYNKIGGDAIQLKLPIEAFYEGYNNPNSEFESVNPYKSNIAKDTMIVTFKNPEGNAAYVNVKVGKYYGYPWYTYLVAKKNPINVYNGISENIGNDTYEVNWYGMTGSEGESKGLVLKETEIGQETKNVDQFITSSGKSISMEDVVKNIGIYMSNPEILLGEEGWVKVYDDDDEGEEPLVTFTKENWNKYNQSNPYKYDEPVSHIRIETSSTNADSYFYFYCIKEINTDYIVENYTKEEFLDFKYIASSVVLYLDSGEKRINSYVHQASYEPSISLADVWVSSSKIPTTEEKNLRINIDTETYDNKEKWVNGIFLLKLPQEMASVEINDVKISNSNVKLANYELYKENDETFIKIITENIDPQSYTITVDCKIIPDATALSSTKYIELYAINEYCTNYHSSYSAEDIYDINKNTNLNELVNYDIASVQFVSTNNLLTSEIITNYDDENNTTYAPSVAGVVKVDRTARVNIKINNNYSGTNSEVVILGRIPFEGNKYVDSGKDMNSTFTTTMSNNGIRVPDVLKNVVTVYYSENGEATRDFNEVNNWQTVPTDYSKIKSFMIKFNDDYKLQRGEKHEFYYDITIPQDVALNAESYSHHAVYFCWDTPQGKYRTKVEPSKVGISPVEKFNLEITKYQTGFDKLVLGATYSVSEVKNIEDGEELVNSRTETTEENGKLLITGLYINKVYEIKEVKTSEGYELNEDVIRISITINSETRELTTEKIIGNIKGDIAVSQEERKISLQVEDETKAKLRLVKTEDGKSEIKLANARFEIKGEGLPTSGKLITTDAQGIAELSGLKIGSIYTIKETYSPSGYYLLEGEVKFKIVNNNNGTFTTEIVEGTAKNSNAVVEDYVPVAVIELTNEKIPIFKLVKTEEATNIPLSGVRFKLYGKGMYENGTTLTTNENGEITLSSLYLNEEYTLQETRAKQGYYIKTEEIKFHIENNNGNYRLIIEQGNEIVKSIQITDTDGVPTLVLTMENERIPVFKIVKKAQGTNDSLSRVRYNIKGKGLPENGTTLTTNENGETQISNLYLNEIYTLQETEAKEGYYIKPETIKFKIVNNNGNYSLEIVEGSEIVKFIDKTEVDNVPYLILNMDNEKIPTFNLDITKVEKDKPEVLLEGAKFRVYRGEVQVGEYISDVNGKIVIPDLCQYVEEKKDIFNSTYRLQEVESPEGYVPIKDITFKVQEIDGTLKFIQEQTEDATMQAFEVEGNTIKLVLEDTPTFKLIKVDGEQTTEVRLPNTKFAIFNINEDEEVPATDSKGNILGTLETIDGKDYYTLTTDENGEFRAELQEGFYKAVEVQVSNDKFELSNQVYYFGIGKSKKSVELKLESMVQLVENSQETSDGGYIGWESFSGEKVLSNGCKLTSNSNRDVVIAKYNSVGGIDWYQQLSPDKDSSENSAYINTVQEISEGKFLITADFKGNEIDVGNGVIIDSYTQYSRYNYTTVLYDSDNAGNVEWAINGRITKKETKDGGYILAGIFKGGSITLEDGVVINNNTRHDVCGGHGGSVTHSNPTSSTCNDLREGYYQDAFIVKYDNNGNALWNKVIEADNDVELNISYDTQQYKQNILTQANAFTTMGYDYRELENGSILITGTCYGSEIDFGDGIPETILDHEMFFTIYDIDGNIVNARISAVNDIIDVEADGGFVTYGNFYDEIDLKKENTSTHIDGQTQRTGLIVNYDKYGITKGYQIIEEVKNTSTENRIISIQKMSDGSYISFGSITYVDEKGYTNITNLIVKYDNLMNEIWRKEIGEIKEGYENYINEVIETSDNEYIFYGKVYKRENSEYEMVIIKLQNDGNQEWSYIREYTNISYEIWELNGNIFIFEIFNNLENPINLGNGIEIQEDGAYLINYNSEMKTQWVIEVTQNLGGYYIPQLNETIDGGFVLKISGKAEGTINIGNNINIEGTGDFTIKYDKNGIPQWVIKGSYNNVKKLSNNEYIVYLEINEEKTIDLGNNIVVNGPGQFIIKYDENNIAKQVVKGIAYQLTDMASESISIDGKINQISSIENTNLNITLFESEIMDFGEGLIVEGPGEFYVDFENKKITNSMLPELKTEDGGLIKYGYITQESKNRMILRPNYKCTDGVIIKYDKDNNVEWRKIIGGELSDGIVYMMQTEDKEFLAVARLESLGVINLGNGTIIENKTPSYVMIKYDELGNAQWYSKISEYGSMMNYLNIGINQIKQTDEGKYIVDLTVYQGEFNIGNTVIEGSLRGQPRVIINYNPIEKNEDNPIVEYAKNVEGNLEDSTELVKETKEGGYYTVSENKDNSNRNYISKITKYTSNGEIALEIPINTHGYATSIDETNDGGCIITINNGNIGYIIKYNENGTRQYTKALNSITLNSIIEINEGEYIVGGALKGESIELGNGIVIQNNSESAPKNAYNNKLSDGIVIKYKETESKNDCDTIWVKSISGTNSDTVNYVSKTQDNGILVAGSFSSSNDIDLGDGVRLKSNRGSLNIGLSGMIIKYSAEGKAEWSEVASSSLKSAQETSDGGYALLRGEAKTDSEVTVTYVDRDRTYTTGCSKGDIITIGGSISEVTGYEFKGWSTNPSAIEGDWAPGDTMVVNTDVTLYAVWEEKSYNVIYTDGVYGEVVFSDDGWENLKVGTSTPPYNLKEGDRTVRPGYMFMGWHPTVNPIVSGDDADENGDIIYTATWAKIETTTIEEQSNYNENIVTNNIINENNIEPQGISITPSLKKTLNIQNITKLDRNRNIEWTEDIENCNITSIKETIEGGYIAGGRTNRLPLYNEMENMQEAESRRSSVNRATDDTDGVSIYSNGIILKLNRDGNEEWRREIEKGPINDVTQIKDTGYIAVGGYISQTLEFENGIVLENKSDKYRKIIDRVWNEETEQYEDVYSDEEYYYSDGMIIKLNAEMMIPEKQELTVKNYYKRFNITTEVELVNGVKGGSITGESLMPYEEVVYGNTSTKPIIMTPEDEKYEIVGITVNGENYPFEVEAGGSFTMPQFENVTEDKHIVVKYCYKDNKIIINKVDSETGEPLEGAKFKLMPEGYVELDYLDAMMHDENDQYYFEKSEDGSYKSNNQGMSNTQAHSSIEVDLTDYEGEYLLEVNASISADNPLYNGVVTVVKQSNSGGGILMSIDNTSESENTSRALDSGSLGGGLIGPLINITGKVEAQNYTRVLTGGSKYTINFIYNRFDNQGGIILQSDNEVTNDTFTINSVKVMSNEFYTVETNSNGQAITNIPFGKYTIKEIQAPDGYILNTEAKALEFRPAETGEDAEQIHTFTFENIKKSKVIVHYYKIDSEGNYTAESLAEDVVLIGNPDEVYTTEIIKNLEKDGIEYELENTILEDGTKTYVIPDNSTGKFKLGEDQEVIYYYMEKKTPLIVHHYIQGTTVGVPLADGTPAKDERSSGKEGENYTTDALTAEELSAEYELVSMPENSTGTYGKDEIVVTYYYKKVNKNVSIFKYALQKQINEETGKEEDVKVPLEGAEFTIVRIDIAENTTSAEAQIRDTEMTEEMVDFSKDDTNTNTNTSLSESLGKPILKPIELPIYTTDKNGKIDVNLELGEYLITEVKAPEGYILPEGEDAKHTITVNKETEDGQLIEIENKRPQGTVIVYHYKIDENGNKTEIPVQIKDGENLVDAQVETQTGDVGNIYATKPVENLPINWKYVEAEGETSGTYAEGEPKVVKYYYKEVDFEETIDIELTKIWKDNEIQALRRPKRIKFTVTPYIENVNQVVIDEKIVSEEYLGNTENTVNQEQNGIQISQETTNNEIVKETETLKENTNEQKIPSEDIKSPEVNIENLEQETKTDEISNDSLVDESNSSVNTTDDTNDIANIVDENSSIAESKETTNTTSQAPTELSNTATDKNNVQENNLPESDTLENNQTEEVTIQELEVTQYYVNVEKGENFTYTLEGLPKYDKTTGSVIHYKITESYDDENGSPDDLKFYTSQGGDVIELIDETGNIKYTSRIINTFTLPSENSKNIKGIKVWNDKENVRNTRPLSIILELVGRINKTDINNEIKQETILSKEQAISFGNNWEYTFENNPIYNADGQEIEYSVDERESVEGSLNKYSKTIITNEDKSEFTITNTLNVQGSNITKTGTEILRAIDGKVNYTINYNAELDVNYSQDENIIVTIVDSLPYKISEKERNIAGGAYDEEKQTITWTGIYNTKSEEQVVVWADGSKTPVTFSEEKQVKVVTFDKKISFSYLGLTTKDLGPIINHVSGTIKLEKSEETVESNCKTLIEYEQDVVVNKLWNGDTEETRPDSITVQLKQVVEDENGNVSFVEIQDKRVSEELKKPITIGKTMENEETEWTYTYKNLPRYDEEGNELKFTVVETEVNYTKGEQTVENKYYCEKTEEVKDGNTIITLTNNAYGSITLTKVDSRKEDVKLKGAEFKLERVIKDETTGEYVVPEEGSEEYFVTTGTTGEDGTLKFENLKYGFYKLTETKAPEDYRISKNPIEIIEVNSSDDEHLNAQVTVGNDKKYSLPLTGGHGINIIRNIGILVISLVAILFTNRKKVVPVKREKTEKVSKPIRRKK